MSRSWLSLLAAVLLLVTGAVAREPNISVRLRPDETVTFRWTTDRCSDNDIPDAPARAFRDLDGAVRLLATHYDNRVFTMVNGALKHVDCRGVLDSPGDPDPAHYRDRRWITATWTDDGRTVHALVHHEFQGQRHPGACAFAEYTKCWYNTITYARSDDGGGTFTQSDPPVVVAAAPFRQDVGQGRPRGFFNPTNIIKRDGFWYVLINTTGWEGQPAGMCLFRTSDISRPELWTAWDGEGFASRFADPYLASALPEKAIRCQPVAKNAFGSVQHIEGGELNIAVFLRESSGSGQRRWALAYSLSKDLITWSQPIDVAPLVYLGSRDCEDKARYGYPSLLDLAGTSRNFDTIGPMAQLYLTRFNVRGCVNSLDRDLVRYQVDIDVSK